MAFSAKRTITDCSPELNEDPARLQDDPAKLVSNITADAAHPSGDVGSFSTNSDGASLSECTLAASIPNRFRFIKVDRSYIRGRWKCDDYADSEQPPSRAASDISTISSNESEVVFATLFDMTNQVACSLDGCLYDAAAVSSDLSKKTVTSPAFCSCFTYPPSLDKPSAMANHEISVAQLKKVLSASEQARFMALHPDEQVDASAIRNSLMSVSSDLLSVGSKEENTYPSEEEIDSKIEAAMDLVKSHLTNAVREEVSELKQRIKKLQETNWLMEKEISMLRQHVPPEVLATLESYLPAGNNSSPTPSNEDVATA